MDMNIEVCESKLSYLPKEEIEEIKKNLALELKAHHDSFMQDMENLNNVLNALNKTKR